MTPTETTEMEIALDRGPEDSFTAEIRVVQPDGEAENRTEARWNLDRSALPDSAAYGRVLMGQLFSDPALRMAFAAARKAGARLRIRLSIGPAAPELHDLRWETLADPTAPDRPLLQDQTVFFSRFLSSADWRTIRLRPRQRLRALVVIANPNDPEARYKLSPVHVAEELQRVRDGLRDDQGGGIPLTVLSSDPKSGRSTLDRMKEAMAEEYDILYLVCHGGLGGYTKRPFLCLDAADGTVAGVSGEELVTTLRAPEHRPRLVVLVSCESAAAQSGMALLALGPRLAEAGIPAVLAMQGKVLMSTITAFMPAFFRALSEDGLVDRAVAVGRGAVADPTEAARPILFLRLRRGRIWYDAGFRSGENTLASWSGLRERILTGKCTPILGPGLLETVFEYRPWLARRWAQTYRFPLGTTQQEDLTQVAQFLAAKNFPTFPHEKLGEDLAIGLRERLPSDTPKTKSPHPLLTALLRQRSAVRPDPYQILANLPLPVYVTTCPDRLLFQTLQQTHIPLAPGEEPVQRRPREAALVWKRDLIRSLEENDQQLPDPWVKDPDYVPSPEEPLVYYLFGQLDAPTSLVLTQDDYFDFLLNFQKQEVHNTIPKIVLKRLTFSAVLFLGFTLDSWEFRAVFRSIMQQCGERGLSQKDRPHVAAQIEPQEGSVINPVAARGHLLDAFKQSQVDVYFGTPDGFLTDLQREMGA